MKSNASVVLGLALALVCGHSAGAHPGALNAEGCHRDHKRGGYHCHLPSPSAAPARLYSAPSTAASIGRSFRNCGDARAAGAAPVVRGSPGYGPHLDRDGDGIGCEPYRGRR